MMSAGTAADYDVAISGFGPVGAVLANLLGQQGLSVVVLERMPDIYDKPRAINIDHEVMRILQSVGLAEAVERIASHHTGTEFRGCARQLIKEFRPLPPPYLLGWPPNLMFVQPEFEPILREGVRRFAAVDVRLRHEVTGIEQDAQGLTVRFADLAEGRSGEGRLRAQYLVACDGATSPLRKLLGVTQDSLDFDEWWTVVDTWAQDPALLPARTTQFCLPSGPVTYVVGPRNLRRWEIKLLPHESPADHADPETVRKRLAVVADPASLDLWRTATYRFHALVAQRWRVGRIFLAGDAAHQMPPFMAQGLCSGLRDAGNLAWKLAGVLRGRYPESLLDTYEAERKPHITELTRITKELGEIIGELDPERAQLRDRRLADELASGRAETVRQKLIPDLVAGLLDRGQDNLPRPAAGTLFPQPLVQDQQQHRLLLDAALGDSFAVVTLGEAPQRWIDARSQAVLDRLHARRVALMGADAGKVATPGVIPVWETGTLLADWMRQRRCGAAVVRPDRYVFGIAAEGRQLRDLICAVDSLTLP